MFDMFGYRKLFSIPSVCFGDLAVQQTLLLRFKRTLTAVIKGQVVLPLPCHKALPTVSATVRTCLRCKYFAITWQGTGLPWTRY